MTSDLILINQLQVDAIIGIYAWEREETQPLIFNIEMSTDIKKSAISDNVADTVCYKAVADEVVRLVKLAKFKLLEALVEETCKMILNNHLGVSSVKLSVNKPNAVEQALTVGLTIYRVRS